MFEFLTATAAHRSSLGVDIAVDFFLVPFIHRCITENIPRNLMLMGSSNASIAQLPKYVKCAGGPFRGVFCGSRGGCDTIIAVLFVPRVLWAGGGICHVSIYLGTGAAICYDRP